MNQGLISTIIPVYNRPGLLAEAVQSVCQQTYRSIEIVIVDDGSTDETADVAYALMSAAIIPIQVILQENSGPGAARQRGLEAASGEYIQFLDSDDLLLPGKFSAQVAALQRRPECGICYGPSAEENHAFNPPTRDWPMRATGERIDCLFPRLLTERWWTTSSPLYRRSLLDQIGPWQPWVNEEDWEYDARCGATRTLLARVEEPCSIRRINLTSNHASAEGGTDLKKLHDRASARIAIYQSALKAGVSPDSPEIRHFSRASFLLSRQCAEAGAAEDAARLYALAVCSSSSFGVPLDLRTYGLLRLFVGWTGAAKVTRLLRRLVRALLPLPFAVQ